MNRQESKVQSDDFSSHRAGTKLGNTLIEVKRKLRDVRDLRASFMHLGRYAAKDTDSVAIVALDEPAISEERIAMEWETLKMILRPAVFKRMRIVAKHGKDDLQAFGNLSADEKKRVESVIKRRRKTEQIKPRRSSDSSSDVLRVLLINWVREKGRLTSKQLGEESGYSYPTISAILKNLESHLIRHSDRSVELRSFPRRAWLRFVSQSEKIRNSRAYTDRSGRPRSLDVLRSRLKELRREDIAIGGIIGARHYVPSLDLVGEPRLDLIVDQSSGTEDNEFLRSLDPALVPAEPGEAARIVVHSLNRPVSFFEKRKGGEIFADEIECLLDLHETRLEQQAAEFLEHLTPGPKS